MERLFIPTTRYQEAMKPTASTGGVSALPGDVQRQATAGLELSCRAITRCSDERVRNALATNLSDLLRYQNMLCRYDTMALKSLDIFSVHGFPVGLVSANRISSV